MRLIRMNKRSRYAGLACAHCGKRVTDGRVAFATTLYVDVHQATGQAFVTTFERKGSSSFRFVYHRSCIEKMLEKGPLDPDVVATMFDEYRERLLEDYEELVP